MFKINKYDPSIDSLEELEKYCADAYLKNKEFFGTDQEILIDFIYDRKEMDKILNFSTPDWLVGCTMGGVVHIFSPQVFDKVSNHQILDFPMVLAHEITHLYTKKIINSKKGCPKWLFEGIAGIPSNQYKKYLGKKGTIRDFNELTYIKDWNKSPRYPQAYLFTSFLISKFGKEKILSLLKSSGTGGEPSEFKSLFKEQLGDDFDEVSKEWLASQDVLFRS